MEKPSKKSKEEKKKKPKDPNKPKKPKKTDGESNSPPKKKTEEEAKMDAKQTAIDLQDIERKMEAKI